MKVRRAGPHDEGELGELYRREAEHHEGIGAWYSLRPGFDWAAMTRSLLGAPERALFVAERERRLVGFIHAAVRGGRKAAPRSWRALIAAAIRRPRRPVLPADAASIGTYGVIEDCYVLPEVRRLGVGRCLVREGVAWLAEQGVDRVELVVMADNPAAVAFWQSFGFAPFRLGMRLDVGREAGAGDARGAS